VNDIFWLKANGNYCYVFAGQTRHLVSCQIGKLLKKMDSPIFMRVSKSYAVNLEKLEKMPGKFIVIKGEEIPIAKKYRAELKKHFTSV